jgi:hypothetical protein
VAIKVLHVSNHAIRALTVSPDTTMAFNAAERAIRAKAKGLGKVNWRPHVAHLYLANGSFRFSHPTKDRSCDPGMSRLRIAPI